MRNIKLTIEYDGTKFHGWQSQLKNQRTIQHEIQKALKKIFQSDITLIGSGRTDSGVHALGQVANFKIQSPLAVEKIKNALNANLLDDITVLNAEEVPAKFHAQYSVKSKIYEYRILNRTVRAALDRSHVLFYPYQLNLKQMRQEAKDFLGRKNFKSFQASDPAKLMAKKENSIRTIKKVEIKRTKDLIAIRIEADGFLYKMVRNIVGTLLYVGSGKLPKGSIKKILSQKDRQYAAPTAKPQGLYLLKVLY